MPACHPQALQCKLREALSNRSLDDENVSQTIKDEGDKGCASDGLNSDAQGRMYATDYEDNVIMRRNPSGEWETSYFLANRFKRI
ncbi:MAG TPA: hypothetical protein VJ695_05275 [Nitrososphaera sp.]|nr:hypothetical protein [Nitrososphaera sp.]